MNKIFDYSKARIAAAGDVAAILLILTGLAVKADGLTVWKLALGILISLLLGGSLLIRKEIRRQILRFWSARLITMNTLAESASEKSITEPSASIRMPLLSTIMTRIKMKKLKFPNCMNLRDSTVWKSKKQRMAKLYQYQVLKTFT